MLKMVLCTSDICRMTHSDVWHFFFFWNTVGARNSRHAQEVPCVGAQSLFSHELAVVRYVVHCDVTRWYGDMNHSHSDMNLSHSDMNHPHSDTVTWLGDIVTCIFRTVTVCWITNLRTCCSVSCCSVSAVVSLFDVTGFFLSVIRLRTTFGHERL